MRMVYKTKKVNIKMGGVEKVFAIFKVINGRYPDLNIHDDRLNIQKLTYILKSIGLPFDYRFNWYIKGPYSPTLASEAFGYVERGMSEVKLSQGDTQVVSNLKSTFSSDISSPGKLELYASLLFIKNQKKLSFRDQMLADKLVSLKPWFTREDALRAIVVLRDSGIFGE